MMRSEVLYFLEGASYATKLYAETNLDGPSYGRALMEEARRRYPDCPPPSDPVKKKVECE